MVKKIFLVSILIFSKIDAYCQEVVKIGNQIWMSKNLNVDRFRNGDLIPEAKSPEEWVKAGDEQRPVWCYFNNDSTFAPTYGKLYNWYAMVDPRGLAPIGWHIPATEEWEILKSVIGKKPKNGKKLQSTSGWYNGENGTNETGFNALPSYLRTHKGYIGCHCKKKVDNMFAYWWTSTPFNRRFGSMAGLWTNFFVIGKAQKKAGLSIRCVKDL